MNLGLAETRSATLQARMRGIWQRSAVEPAYVTALAEGALGLEGGATVKHRGPRSLVDRGHLLRTTLATRRRPLVAEP
jgi:hypothetical protein